MKTLIKVWDFDSNLMGMLEYSSPSDITLDARHSRLTLKERFAPGTNRLSYPTNDDIYVIMPSLDVQSLQELHYIQVISITPNDLNGATPTAILMRLYDGAQHYYWNGANWTIGSAWNTVEDMVNHLRDWNLDVPFSLVVSLKTTNRAYTPTVSQIKLLYSVELPSFIDDWVYNVIVDGMAESIRPVSDLITEAIGNLQLDLSALDLQGSWNITDVVGVWDEDLDAKHRQNLLDEYDIQTRVIILSTAPAEGARLRVRYRYAPQVAVQTSQDYVEVESCPSLLFDNIMEDELGAASAAESIMNCYVDPPSGVILPAPRRANIRFNLLASAPTSVDLDRLMEAVATFLTSNATVTSRATGITRSLRVIESFNRRIDPSLNDSHMASMSFMIENVYKWHLGPVSVHGVASLGVGFQVGAGTDTVTL